MARTQNSRTWLEHAMSYVDMKWPQSSAKHRKSIAEALATVTPVFYSTERGAPSEKMAREALYGWAFNKGRRDGNEEVPEPLTVVWKWLKENSIPLRALDTDTALIRKALDALSVRINGQTAAPTTIARKRAVFSGVLKYAVEIRQLETHPLPRVSWKAPKAIEEVDRRSVANPTQARALLQAVRGVAPDYEAFFGCLYYAALRPEEALHLRDRDIVRPIKKGGWGWLHLTGATVTGGQGWTDDGKPTEDRGLKHRARKASRPVPAAPALLLLLDAHLKAYGTGPDGRLFVTRRGPGGRYVPTTGRPFSSNAYGRVWKRARQKALSEAECASPLARVPYDLRHAAVSLWLNGGVPATQVAEWAGHSVNVLMRVYAKCVDGQEDAARRRIAAALAAEDTGDGDDAPKLPGTA